MREVFGNLGFRTASDTMLPVLRQAHKAAYVSDITILIEGETGTGKQVLAHAVHQLDKKRRNNPFITVHCSTINESLAESELFGHEPGAFSGAINRRKGLFQAAHRGTLFLDDVNDLPPALQPKLLDVIQRSKVRSVGSDLEAPIDVRIVAAANQPLAPLVQQNKFRADLYHRLNVVKVRLPALRERPEDLPALILDFARRRADVYAGIVSVDPELVRYLQLQTFPGNVRELEHAVERALFGKTSGSCLELADWAEQANAGREESCEDPVKDAAASMLQAIFQDGLPYCTALRQLEKKLLESALMAGGQTRREIASRLQTSERTLYHKLRSFRLTHQP
ncbi:MAG TPA: sigma-54 dependent transcriptional regulator [Bryobacteraceae bacterium]